MRRPTLTVLLMATIVGTPLSAQIDGLILLPDTYRVQFENEWVRVVHVHIAGNASLPPHNHPPGLMLHVYLNDADPIQFDHGEAPGLVTRPPVKARSYRIGRATPETHSVFNLGPGASDYLRVELKTKGSSSPRRRVAAPPLGTATTSVVEENGEQFRSTRITIAAGGTTEIAASAAEPSLVIALTDGVTVTDSASTAAMKLGGERFIAPGRRATFASGAAAATQLLKIDFLTRP